MADGFWKRRERLDVLDELGLPDCHTESPSRTFLLDGLLPYPILKPILPSRHPNNPLLPPPPGTNKTYSEAMALYIEWVWPHTERSGSSGETPMSDAKGSTNPPFGDYAHRILDSNRVASDYLFAALEETSNCGVKHLRVSRTQPS